MSFHHTGPWHYEHIPARGPDAQYRVADADDDVVASFATEDEAQSFVRTHNDRLSVNPSWKT